MCLVVLAWQVHPLHDLVLAANRDEYHARPTGPLDRWPDLPGVRAGRDLAAAGTWLAVHEDGRFATVTNVRGESSAATQGPSRGDLVAGFLASNDTPAAFARRIAAQGDAYAGFNLLLGDRDSLWYLSNRGEPPRPLAPGVHALSNDRLGTQWPKLQLSFETMGNHVDRGRADAADLFGMLAMREAPWEDETLVWPARSGPFIEGDVFGTRSSTVVQREPGGLAHMEERRFGPLGTALGATRLAVPPAAGGS